MQSTHKNATGQVTVDEVVRPQMRHARCNLAAETVLDVQVERIAVRRVFFEKT